MSLVSINFTCNFLFNNLTLIYFSCTYFIIFSGCGTAIITLQLLSRPVRTAWNHQASNREKPWGKRGHEQCLSSSPYESHALWKCEDTVSPILALYCIVTLIALCLFLQDAKILIYGLFTSSDHIVSVSCRQNKCCGNKLKQKTSFPKLHHAQTFTYSLCVTAECALLYHWVLFYLWHSEFVSFLSLFT